MTAHKTLKYFAYGSNMHPLRLRRRTPSCTPLTVAKLTGHVLRFHKRGQDGSGKCNIFATGRALDHVIGVVYTLDVGEKPLLDLAEGLGGGYDEATLQVVAGETEHMVFCYRAQPSYIDDSLRPFAWYKALVLAGSQAHGLPTSYVEQIRAWSAIDDPDPARTARHLRILEF